ncbi:MAG: PolC-type DNA polymerase III [Candidatus Izemoplasmataceae bacterium]
MKPFNDYNQIVIFDVETSGLSSKEASIIELGAIIVKPLLGEFVIEEEVSVLINIKQKLPDEIIKLTNITDEMLKTGISEEELFKIMKKLTMPNTLLIAYNLPFDYGFFKALFYKYEGHSKSLDQCDFLDMLTCYRAKHAYPHKLDHAVAMYEVSVPNTHRALDDVLATYELFLKMHKAYNLEPFINVIGVLKKYPYQKMKLSKIKTITQ